VRYRIKRPSGLRRPAQPVSRCRCRSADYCRFDSYVADGFGTDDAGLGVALAVTRIGVLLSLVATASADRRGRRQIVVVSTAGLCLANALAALAPSLSVFTGTQVLVRTFVNATGIVAGIAVIEEAPEGARAFSGAMLGLAGGFGFSFAVIGLPFADLGPEAWRLPFALSGLSVLFVPKIARHLRETTRYAAITHSGIERGRIGEVLDRRYGRRFWLLAAIAFLGNVFNAPSAQLTNRYLDQERGFSGLDVSIFRGVTSGVPGLLGILAAGRLAERRGRRQIAAVATVLATGTQMVFFLTSGVPMWVGATVSVVTAAAAGVAIATLDTELFPTEVRGTSSSLLLLFGVSGSIVGLVLAGVLSDALGGLGNAIALLGIGSLASAVLLVPRLPEPAGRLLDDVSPSIGGAGAATTGETDDTDGIAPTDTAGREGGTP